MSVHGPIDLLHRGAERVIGVYLLETEDGPALFDCGPTSCVDALKRGLADRGLALGDVRHLLLSHIHLDHAGAAGTLVREHPELQVHVSEIGAPHLVDPSRLERSARRLYGDAFDTLWGELAPVPEENVHVVGERILGLDCFPSPGHASHHICYLGADAAEEGRERPGLAPGSEARVDLRESFGVDAEAADHLGAVSVRVLARKLDDGVPEVEDDGARPSHAAARLSR